MTTRENRSRRIRRAPTATTRRNCQPKTVCVPLVALKGDSYRLRDRDLGRVPTARENT
jgi:hypothetical protein